jgi:hypothetical protein
VAGVAFAAVEIEKWSRFRGVAALTPSQGKIPGIMSEKTTPV